VIDGCEGAYKFKTEAEYKQYRDLVRGAWRAPSSVPDLYDRYVRVGFGKWLDAGEGGTSVWDAKNIARNYYSPDGWEASLRAALDQTDEYVWVWAGGVGRALAMPHDRAPNVPDAYFAATRRARRRRTP
jgi:hypothetical protein